MKRFKRILVGVDLSWGDRFVAGELSEPNAEAVHQALWLAKLNAASIDFLYALDLSPKAQELISESSTDESKVLEQQEPLGSTHGTGSSSRIRGGRPRGCRQELVGANSPGTS